MNASRRIVAGKHPAIRLGLSIAVLLYSAAAGLLAQAGDSTFRILESGTAIGAAAVAITRDEEGWRVQSTSRAAGKPIRARRVSLLVIRDMPTPIEIWVAEGMLLKIELPLDHRSLIRSGIMD